MHIIINEYTYSDATYQIIPNTESKLYNYKPYTTIKSCLKHISEPQAII